MVFIKLYNIIVVDEVLYELSRIFVFIENGKFIEYISKYLINLCSVFVRSDGNIVVCDLGDVFIKIFFFDVIELLWFFRVRNYDVFLWCVVYY